MNHPNQGSRRGSRRGARGNSRSAAVVASAVAGVQQLQGALDAKREVKADVIPPAPPAPWLVNAPLPLEGRQREDYKREACDGTKATFRAARVSEINSGTADRWALSVQQARLLGAGLVLVGLFLPMLVLPLCAIIGLSASRIVLMSAPILVALCALYGVVCLLRYMTPARAEWVFEGGRPRDGIVYRNDRYIPLEYGSSLLWIDSGRLGTGKFDQRVHADRGPVDVRDDLLCMAHALHRRRYFERVVCVPLLDGCLKWASVKMGAIDMTAVSMKMQNDSKNLNIPADISALVMHGTLQVFIAACEIQGF